MIFAFCFLAVLPSIVADDFCNGKKDGLFSLKKCSSEYISCSNGNQINLMCSSGFFFNPETLQCEHPEDIPKCTVKTDCSKRGDGLYSVRECDSMFVHCNNGRANVGTCQDNYLFNDESGLCETPNEKFCPEMIVDGAEMECSNGSVVQYWKPTNVKETRTAPKERSSNEQDVFHDFGQGCEYDGSFAMADCSAVYKVCLNNVATFHECPNGLVFNSHVRGCDSSCEDVKVPLQPTTTVEPTIVPQNYAELTTTATPQIIYRESSSEIDAFHGVGTFCENDGVFALAECSPVYKVCSNNVASFHECPDGFVFNAYFSGCASSCEDVKIQLQPITTVKPTIVPQNYVKSTTTTTPKVAYRENSFENNAIQGAEISCEEDGVFAIAECSPVYRICSNKFATFHECPEGFVFNSQFSGCASSCEEVNVPLQSVVSSTPPVGHQPDLQNHAKSTTTTTPQTIYPENSLENDAIQGAETNCEKDGIFPVAECSPVYQICSNNVGSFHECPDGLVFNAYFSGCASSCEDVKVPLQSITTVKPTVAYQPLPQNPPKSTTTTTPQTIYPENSLENDAIQGAGNDCEKDGVFAVVDCSPVYKVCSNNVASFHECPDGLVFNVYFSGCASSCEDVRVQMQPITTVKPTVVYQPVPHNYAKWTTTTTPHSTYPENSLENDAIQGAGTYCEKDGVFAVVDCSPVYKTCSNNIASFHECPDGFVFNAYFSGCASSCEDVKISSQSVVTATPPVAHQPELQNYAKSTTTTTPKTAYRENSLENDAIQGAGNDCEKDGVFAVVDCSPVYKVCSNNLASFRECPDGLVFNAYFSGCATGCEDIKVPLQPITTVKPTVVYQPPPQNYAKWTTTTTATYRESSLENDAIQDVGTNCENDGIFPVAECSPVYQICSNKFGAFHECPEGFVFNSHISGCAISCGKIILEEKLPRPTVQNLPPQEVVKPFQPDRSYKSPSYHHVNDEFSKNSGYRPVVTVVDEHTKDGFTGDFVDEPIKNPFAIPNGPSHIRRDSFDREGQPEYPAISPFISNSKPRGVFDGFYGEAVQLPIRNPFVHFKTKNNYHRAKFGYGLANPSVDNSSIVDEILTNDVQNETVEVFEKLPEFDDTIEGSGSNHTVEQSMESIEFNGFNTTNEPSEVDDEFDIEHHLEEENFWRSRRSAEPMCWIKQHAYRPVILGTVSTRLVDDESFEIQPSSECLGRKDGHSFISGLCRRTYFVCSKGISVQKTCSRSGDVFDSKLNDCVAMADVRECEPVVFDASRIVTSNTSSFCDHRKDGFYKHPSECHRILQCFGRNMFEHPSCEHGLAFDERRGRCDYQHNVPGCGASTAFDENSASGCNGHEHGAHVVDQADCNSFYRCVWNQLERMTCPRGTVFNPALSVCDYPDQVPGCSQ